MAIKMIDSRCMSVVVPAYNEEGFLVGQLENFLSSWKLRKLGRIEMLVVENGSRDNTWGELLSFHYKHPEVIPLRCEKASYGEALKRGLLAATGGSILCIDVDYFDFAFLEAALKLTKQSGVVVGSKVHPRSIDSRHLYRLATTRILNWIIRFVFNYPGTDTHGLKCFQNTSLLRTCIRLCVTQSELFDTELLVRLYKEKVRITEIPVRVTEVRASRTWLIIRCFKAMIEFGYLLFSRLVGGMNRYGQLSVVMDDFGWSYNTDKCICAELDNESHPTVSILANMMRPRSVMLLKQYAGRNQVHYSLHFNLVEGKPCGPKHLTQSLVDNDGNFYALPWFVLRLFFGLICLDEVKYELLAQYQKVALVFAIDHLDSHQHIHQFGPIAEVVGECLHSMGNPRVRSFNSSQLCLSKKPFKYVVFMGVCGLFNVWMWILSRKRTAYATNQELIIHPGFQYDESRW